MKMGFLVYELGFRPKLAWELGFEAWELGFGPKLGWELGFRTPLQDPLDKYDILIISFPDFIAYFEDILLFVSWFCLHTYFIGTPFNRAFQSQ